MLTNFTQSYCQMLEAATPLASFRAIIMVVGMKTIRASAKSGIAVSDKLYFPPSFLPTVSIILKRSIIDKQYQAISSFIPSMKLRWDLKNAPGKIINVTRNANHIPNSIFQAFLILALPCWTSSPRVIYAAFSDILVLPSSIGSSPSNLSSKLPAFLL